MKLIDQKYYLNIANAVRRTKCSRRNVGAVLVLENRIIATGYNGTPIDHPNCTDGGCPRCADAANHPPGEGYESCVCIHAEANCFLTAARFGVSVRGSWLFTTLKPCLNCLKSAAQVGVIGIRYAADCTMSEESPAYEFLVDNFEHGVFDLIAG